MPKNKGGRPEKGHVRVTLHVPPEVRQQLKVAARVQQKTMSEIVVHMLEKKFCEDVALN